MNVSDAGCTVTASVSSLDTATVTLPIGSDGSTTVYVPALPSVSATVAADRVGVTSSSLIVTVSVALLPS